MITDRFGKVAIVFATLSLLCGSSAHALITTQAWYQLGEADPGATAGASGDNPTVDSSSNGNNLTLSGSPAPTYSSDTAPLSDGSTLSMQFNGSTGYYSSASSATTATTDVVLEAWVKPALTTASSPVLIAYNGNGGLNGYGIAQNDSEIDGLGAGDLYVLRSGQGFTDLGHFTTAQWVNIAVVFDGSGNMQAYINGLPGPASGPANAPGTGDGFDIGGATSDVFDGNIDQVRVFTYAGAFDPADLLLVPEPHTMMIVVAAAPLLLLRRRRVQM